MIVSIVIPETGLRAAAIAFAATDVKKEKTSVSPRPTSAMTAVAPRSPRKIAMATAETTTPMRIFMIPMSRSVRSVPACSPCRHRLRRDRKRTDHDLERFDDAEDAGSGDGAHANELDVVAENLSGGHLERSGPRPGR